MAISARAATNLPSALRSLGLAGLMLLLILLSIVFPIVSSLAVLVFVAVAFRSRQVGIVAGILSVCLFFGWMNSEKSISGDWGWYTQHYLWLNHMSFSDYIGNKIGPFKIKITEPVYYFVSFLVSRLSDGSIDALAWTVTVLIYLPLGIAVAAVHRKYVETSLQGFLLIVIPLAVGITFTLTTQLVRQEIAAAFLVLGFTLYFSRGPGWAIFFVGLGILSHNSALVPASVLALAVTLLVRDGRIRIWRTAFFASVMLVVGLAFVTTSASEGFYTQGKNDGSVSLVVVLFDATIFALFYRFRNVIPELKKYTLAIVAVVFVYSGFLLGVVREPLPLLRMYFYVECFRVLMISFLVLVSLRSKFSFLTMAFGVLFALVFLEFRIASSPFWYKGGVVAHFLRPFAIFQ